jgi:hypothetical protein
MICREREEQSKRVKERGICRKRRKEREIYSKRVKEREICSKRRKEKDTQ